MPESHRYEAHPALRRKFETIGRKLAFNAKDRSEWRAWRGTLLRKVRSLTGYDTFKTCPLRPLITEKLDFGDYVRQRVEIQTEPGVIMPFYVLIPRNVKGPFPAVITQHGHGSGGKAVVVDDRSRPEYIGAIEKYNYAYGVEFVRAGFIVFAADARGFGERQESKMRETGVILEGSCRFLAHMGIPMGQAVAGMWAWDLHRLVDYIGTRPDCIPGRVGCAGLSGGGLQTLYASVLDERIRCAVISGYLYGFKESLVDQYQHCDCNFVPHLYEYADMGDIAALIAPRPLMIETGDKDPLNGKSLKNVTDQVKIIRRAYKAVGVNDRISHCIFPGVHRWYGKEAIPWMQRWLAE